MQIRLKYCTMKKIMVLTFFTQCLAKGNTITYFKGEKSYDRYRETNRND